MFELMDANNEALEVVHKERQELESLWKQEKDKLKATQMVNVLRQFFGVGMLSLTSLLL